MNFKKLSHNLTGWIQILIGNYLIWTWSVIFDTCLGSIGFQGSIRPNSIRIRRPTRIGNFTPLELCTADIPIRERTTLAAQSQPWKITQRLQDHNYRKKEVHQMEDRNQCSKWRAIVVRRWRPQKNITMNGKNIPWRRPLKYQEVLLIDEPCIEYGREGKRCQKSYVLTPQKRKKPTVTTVTVNHDTDHSGDDNICLSYLDLKS